MKRLILRVFPDPMRVWFTLPLTLVLIVLSTLLSAAQSFSSLTLEIVLDRSQFLALEPIPLRVGLRNDTAAAVRGHSLLKFSSGFVDILVAREDGGFRAIENLSPLHILIAAKPELIQAGQVLESQQELLLLDLERIFPEPGLYHIKAVLHSIDRSESIESYPRDIEIIPPTGRAADAFQYIRTSGASASFFSGLRLGSDKQYHERLAEFASLYEDTPYGPYAHYVIGQFYFHTDDCTQAVRSFQRVTSIATFVFINEAESLLEQCNEKLK